MLTGHVFTEQIFESYAFAYFVDAFLDHKCGVGDFGNNMKVTSNESKITIQDGLACIKGRFVEEDNSTTLEAGTENLFCSLVIEVDLDKENTEEELKQLSYKILSDATKYPELIQTDIIKNRKGIYQYELARFKTSEKGITELKDTRTYIDIKCVLNSMQKEFKDFLEKMNHEIENMKDKKGLVTNERFDGNILFESQNGITNGNIDLNDDWDKYKTIEFYDNTGRMAGKIDTNNGNKINLMAFEQGTQVLFMWVARLMRTENTLVFNANSCSFFDGEKWGKSDARLSISKIIGYKVAPKEEILSIKVEEAQKIRYKENLDIDNIRLIIEKTYDNGKTTIETFTTLSDPECKVTYINNYVGIQKATVEYKNLTTKFDLTIEDYIIGLTIENNGKTEYSKGETIDTSGIVVKTVMASGLAGETVTPDSIEPSIATVIGSLGINVTYGRYVETFFVTVRGVKIEYKENDKLQGELPNGYKTTKFITVLWSGDYKATYTLNGGSPIAITSGTELRKPGKYVLTVGEGIDAVIKEFEIIDELPSYAFEQIEGGYKLIFNRTEQIGEVAMYIELEDGTVKEGDIRDLSNGELQEIYVFTEAGYYFFTISTIDGIAKDQEFTISKE